MTHMVESHLVLTHAPLSIRDFNHLKTVEFHRELLNQATLYAIARKEVSTLKVNEEASNANAIFLDAEMKKAGVHLNTSFLYVYIIYNFILKHFCKILMYFCRVC